MDEQKSRLDEVMAETDISSPVVYAPVREKNSDPKKKRRVIAIALACVIFIVAVGGFGIWFGFFYEADKKAVEWAIQMAENYYYPEGFSADAVYREANPDKGLDGLIESFSAQLDPYSQFFKPSEFQAYIDEGEGHNRGIGISTVNEGTEEDPLYKVAIVVTNSPADLGGVKKGMYLLGYGESQTTMTAMTDYDAFTAFLDGREDSFYLSFGYASDGSDAQNYSLKRESYQATYCYYRDSETAYYFHGADGKTFEEVTHPVAGLDDTTAYIRIDEFSGNVSYEFLTCLGKMKERGRENLILDLRTNGGGFLTDLQSISSHLLKDAEQGSKPVVATARFKDGNEEKYEASDPCDYSNYFTANSQVYVLADENTASASECLIGALVDYGTVPFDHIYLREDEDGVAKTYGKGIMQSSFQHYTGAAVKLTVAGIFWPNGNSIHGRGVTKDDGAHGVPSEMFWGEQDVMLEYVIGEVCAQ